MNKKLSYILRLAICLCVLLSAGWGYVLFGHTLMPGWIPLCIASLFAIATLGIYRRWAWFTGSSRKAANIVCHLLCTASLGYGLFLSSNYYGRDKDTPQETVAVLLDKHSENQERRNRIGRHRYQTTHVQNYSIEAAFENGLIKTLDVSRAQYKAAHGDTLRLILEKGMWGFPIIEVMLIKNKV